MIHLWKRAVMLNSWMDSIVKVMFLGQQHGQRMGIGKAQYQPESCWKAKACVYSVSTNVVGDGCFVSSSCGRIFLKWSHLNTFVTHIFTRIFNHSRLQINKEPFPSSLSDSYIPHLPMPKTKCISSCAVLPFRMHVQCSADSCDYTVGKAWRSCNNASS